MFANSSLNRPIGSIRSDTTNPSNARRYFHRVHQPRAFRKVDRFKDRSRFGDVECCAGHDPDRDKIDRLSNPHREGPPVAVAPNEQPALSAPTSNSKSTLRMITAHGAAAAALSRVRADLGECTRCKLHLTRNEIVFGAGNPTAALMLIGEAPSQDEDCSGVPFGGITGRFVAANVKALGLTLDDVYVTNVIKCEGSIDKTGDPLDCKMCLPFVYRQIDAIRPKAILALGDIAVRELLGTTVPLWRLRGRVHRCREAKLIATYDPIVLLQNPSLKRKVWEDLMLVRRQLSTRVH